MPRNGSGTLIRNSAPAIFPAYFQPFKIVVLAFVDNVVIRKPTVSSINNGVSLQIGKIGKIGGNILGSINGHLSGYRLIPLLLFSAGPSAVFRRVSRVIINSIKSVSCGPVAHIGNKVFKTLLGNKPLFADGYSSTPVIFKLLKLGVMASVFHAHPDIIKRVGIFKWHSSDSLEVASIING